MAELKTNDVDDSSTEMNWAFCALCQADSDNLVNPFRKQGQQATLAGYHTVAENLKELAELDALPTIVVSFSLLDDGSGIEETLKKNKAQWHKTCYSACNNRAIKRAKSNLKHKSLTQDSPIKSKLRRVSDVGNLKPDEKCFICEISVEGTKYHQAETKQKGETWINIAQTVGNTKLLAKLSSGDVVAADAVYHQACSNKLITEFKAAMRVRERNSSKSNIDAKSLALAELVSYIEDAEHQDECANRIFCLADLIKLYKTRLEQLGEDTTERIHSTRLKDKLLERIPNLQANPSKNGTILSFKADIGDLLYRNCRQTTDSNAVTLMHASNIVREEILKIKYKFEGSLIDDQHSTQPKSLEALVQMILYGSNIKEQSRRIGKETETLTQLLTFNAIKRGRKSAENTRHNPDRETSFPLYIGLFIYNKTRKRELIDKMFEHGLSISYPRVIQLTTQQANQAISQFHHDGVVCPSVSKGKIYTTGNLDNIDHNTSSTSAQSSFHGTAISVTQHPTQLNFGTVLENKLQMTDEIVKMKTIMELPEEYSYVPPAFLCNDRPVPPTAKDEITQIPSNIMASEDKREMAWLKKVNELTKEETVTTPESISWSAYHANEQTSTIRPPAIIGMFPLFRENAHSLAMVKHGMDVIQKATQHVNPGQVPVITVDHPLYVLAKKIQWAWPQQYGENKYVVMMGGLHIEMALLKTIGDWLSGSGWTTLMAEADVLTEGRAEGVLNGSHVTRGQWAFQVTAASLYKLQTDAYSEYIEDNTDGITLSFTEWGERMSENHPQFCYWNKTLQLLKLFLCFLRSQREGQFHTYIETLRKIIPWFFALDHFNYSKWMSIHVKDLLELQTTSPSTYEAFMNGHFVTQKAKSKFSCLAHDQVHEQCNAIIKGDGGIIGITENDNALQRWMTAGPEISKMLNEYNEQHSCNTEKGDKMNHHEQTPSTQREFAKDVRNVTAALDEMANPFSDNGMDLYTLDTKVVMSKEVEDAVKNVERIGNENYQEFVQERLNNCTEKFYETVTKHKLTLFKSNSRKPRKKDTKAAGMKSDVQLFPRMYIACQNRDGDLDTFFKHENHAWPPSLAENDMMRATNKSDLLTCIEPLVPKPTVKPEVDMKIIDGAFLVHTLDPKKSNVVLKTFQDYSQKLFLPYVTRQLNNVKRLDIVWDTYIADSLKSQARECRGDGQTLRVQANTKLPRNWNSFLRVNENKEALFKFLAQSMMSLDQIENKHLVTTLGNTVYSSKEQECPEICPCNHEEADYRMMLHAFHGYNHNIKKILIRATDTDVVVLAISAASTMADCELWVEFGTGKHQRLIAAHSIAAQLGPSQSSGLLLLHAISGCDNVSSFYGIGKKTAWKVWRSLVCLEPLFLRLTQAPSSLSEEDIDELERFVVLLYSKTSSLSKVNEARKSLFSQGNRQLDKCPPTRAALVQHVRRAVYQAGHIWGQALVCNPELPSPSDWGWKRNADGGWVPFWTAIPEASKGCRELIRCECKTTCLKGKCNCAGKNLKCTDLCVCAGQCDHNST